MTSIRTQLLAWAAGAFFATTGAPALACLPELPPPWSSVLKQGGPTVFLGRVVQIKLEEPPRRAGPYEITDATAWIRPLEVIQGEFTGEARVTGAVMVREVEDDAPMYCGDFLGVTIGQPVMVVSRADGTYRTVAAENLQEPLLAPLLERHGGPRR